MLRARGSSRSGRTGLVRRRVGQSLPSLGSRDQEPAAVLEACTDVSLGLGLDALEIYAEQLVNAAYTEAE